MIRLEVFHSEPPKMNHPLCTDDVVAAISNSGVLAVVERTHNDVDTHDPYLGHDEILGMSHDKSIDDRAFRKFKKDGIPPRNTVPSTVEPDGWPRLDSGNST